MGPRKNHSTGGSKNEKTHSQIFNETAPRVSLKESLMPSLEHSSYWIGLKKPNASAPWVWANGDAFDNW